MRSSLCCVVLWLACLLGMPAAPARGLINPSLQPADLFERYRAVVAATVKQVDADALAIELDQVEVIAGKLKADRITIKAEDDGLLEAIFSVGEGQRVVAYVGQKGRGARALQVLYYVGGGTWFEAELAAADTPDRWKLIGNADQTDDGQERQIMFGTFNGKVESLATMMRDVAAGRGYFPARPFTRFGGKTLAKLEGPIRGVGLHDLNGDGRLDALACGEAGVRLFIQNEDGGFDDHTEAAGLAGVPAVSCSAADADGDGDVDLLLDAALYVQTGGRFERSGGIGAAFNTDVLSAAFVELDGDGRPDVVVSRRGRGLTLLLNPGQAGGAWRDATVAMGLAELEGLAGGSGYFEYGDWNLDGRTDLIDVTGPGWLLIQNDAGVFEPAPLGPPDEDYGLGAAAFGAVVTADTVGAFIGFDDRKMLIEADDGWRDVTRYGNEIQDDAPGLLPVVAADLNADGTVDLYGAPRRRGAPSFFLANRGYGSFMLSEKYAGGKIFPTDIYNAPAGGLATGDVNGDGAIDLLVGGLDGSLHLMLNQTLDDRPEQPDVATLGDERKRIQARLLTVRPVGGVGVVGSRLTLRDAAGRVVARRFIGNNIGVGCAQPAEFDLAVREPGDYTLHLRFGDGAERTESLTLGPDTPRHQLLPMPRPATPRP